MKTIDILKALVEQIHTTVVATVDENNTPVTCAIDMMDYDENGLYFMTAKGKSFYKRLCARPSIALTGMKGSDTMSTVAVSVKGKVRELGSDRLLDLFDKNPYMKDIYLSDASRTALTVLQLYEGNGEIFDLSKLPPERTEFTIGDAAPVNDGYFVSDKCIGCKICYSRCPQKNIDITVKPVVIDQTHCIRCGNCYEVCPARAIIRKGEKRWSQ